MTAATFAYLHAPRIRTRVVNGIVDRAAALRDTFVDIFLVAPIEPVEGMHALSVLAFGLWMCFVPVFSSAAGYDGMRRVGSTAMAAIGISASAERAWGVAGVAIAIAQLWALLTGRRSIRRTAAMAEAMLFAFVLGALVSQDWRFLATAVFTTYAGISLWIFIRIGRHASTTPHQAP